MIRIFTVCIFICSFFISKASNIPGADMSYVYLGSGNYKIIITAYRDCNGIQLSSGNATITSGKTTFSLNLKTESVEDISKINKSCIKSKCAGGSYAYGFEKHVFYGIVNLGAYTNLCEFNVSWQQCCRSGAITTGASGENFHVDMLINRCYDSTNSAPQFMMPPLTTIALNEPVTYNPVMIDSMDGFDSLSYEMVLPLRAAGTGISYTGLFSLDAPLKYFGFPKTGLKVPAGFHLDNVGNMRFTPINLGDVTTIVLKVTEWKNINGVMRIMSELKRDMQVIVVKSTNHEPQPQDYNNNFNACVGKPYTFEIPFTDIDSITFLHGRVISEIPGLTYKIIRDTTALNNKTIIKVELTPNSSMVRKNPYQFTVIVNDSSCKDLLGEFVYTYNLFIKAAIDTSSPAVIHVSKMNCNDYQFKAKDSLGFGYSNWEWFDDTMKLGTLKDLTFTATEIGTKKITLKAYKEGCYVESATSVYTPVVFKTNVQIISSSSVYCRNSNIVLKTKSSGATNPLTYFWPDLNFTGDSLNILHNISRYKVVMTDSNNCMDSAEIKIGIYELPGVNLGNDTSKCTNDLDGIKLTANSASNLKLFYDWHGLGNTKSITVKPKFGQNIYKVRVIDANFCVSSDSILIEGYTLTADAGKDSIVCKKLTNYPLKGNTNANLITSQFEWQNISNTQNTLVDVLATKTFNFTVKDNFGCSASDVVTVTIANPPFVNLNPLYVCEKDSFVLSANVSGYGPFTYTWKFDNTTYSGNDIKLMAPNSGKYVALLEVKDNNTCIKNDSNLLTVKPIPFVKATVIDHLCKAAGTSVNLNEKVIPIGGLWTENKWPISTIFKSNDADTGWHVLTYTFTDNITSCSNSDLVSIYVVPPSEIDFNASTMFGKGPLKVDFSPSVKSYTPTTNYLWYFGDDLNSTSTATNTSFTYDKMGIYSVRLVIGSNGYCPEEELLKKNYIEVSAGASVISQDNSLIQVHPVPSKDKVLVSLPLQMESLYLEWYDMRGRKIGSKSNFGTTTEIMIELPGVYVLKIFSGNNFIGNKKLVIE